MNALTVKILGADDLLAIATNPGNYPEEVLCVAIDVIRDMSAQIYEAKKRIEGHIIKKMQLDNATKQSFRGTDGKEKMATLKFGSMKCKNKEANIIYRDSGFDPKEIGEYVFKPSWSKAKEARKFGGEKQLIIDELFKQGNTTIEIK